MATSLRLLVTVYVTTRIQSTKSALYRLARAHRCSRHSRQCKSILDSIMSTINRGEPRTTQRVHFVPRSRMIHLIQKTKHAPVVLHQLCRGHRHTKMPHTPDTSTTRCHAPGVAVHIPLTTELPPPQMRSQQIRTKALVLGKGLGRGRQTG